MIEILESAANLHRIAVHLNNEGRKEHAQVLRKTIELELRELWGEKANAKSQEIKPLMDRIKQSI